MIQITAFELIPIVLVLRDRFVKDEESKKVLNQLVMELIALATEEFLIRFGLVAS